MSVKPDSGVASSSHARATVVTARRQQGHRKESPYHRCLLIREATESVAGERLTLPVREASRKENVAYYRPCRPCSRPSEAPGLLGRLRPARPSPTPPATFALWGCRRAPGPRRPAAGAVRRGTPSCRRPVSASTARAGGDLGRRRAFSALRGAGASAVRPSPGRRSPSRAPRTVVVEVGDQPGHAPTPRANRPPLAVSPAAAACRPATPAPAGRSPCTPPPHRSSPGRSRVPLPPPP